MNTCRRSLGICGSASQILAFLLAIALTACLGCTTKRTPRLIPAILQRQADDWNRGDIESFMSAYWKSPHLTFASGGDITRGFEATLERYRTKYPTTEKMGKLTFSDLEVRPLDGHHALVVGRWNLERAEPVGGVFTLVLRLMGDRWVIIHDHTSKTM